MNRPPVLGIDKLKSKMIFTIWPRTHTKLVCIEIFSRFNLACVR
jgi:hypothetical protein